MIVLPYTICFCLCGDQVLMLSRTHPPNAGLWNGLGGKLEADETPVENIYREVMEEAALDLHQAQQVRFAGLVTWMALDHAWGCMPFLRTWLLIIRSGRIVVPWRVSSPGRHWIGYATRRILLW
jgi:8-oxo-dGTP pyrophosphatase MutT (NUDIX family)